jgi:chromosome segregation ATPase
VLQTGLAAAFGFFAAMFLVLLLAPTIARRISELTWRQAIRVLPQSSEEIAASRDHLRGQSAIEIRQLEMKMEAIAEKERLLQIGKQAFEDRIASLTGSLEQSNASITKLETIGAGLTRDLDNAVQNNAMLTTENADRDVRLAAISTELAQWRNDYARQTTALNLTKQALHEAEQQSELVRKEASALRSRVSVADSELRMARTEAKRHEGDTKLANRKNAALEGKLERSIRLMAEAEEKLVRREAELKRLKETGRPAGAALPSAQAAFSPKAVPALLTVKPVVVAEIAAKSDAVSDSIVTQIAALRQSIRVATPANVVKNSAVKAEMMDLAGRITSEAATQNPVLKAKIAQLKPEGSALAVAILKHSKAAE